MRSLLTALRDGRLVELPRGDKETSLRYLAHLIEAVPQMTPGVDVAEEILNREKAGNSGIGRGVACPHIRVPWNGDLLSSVGWSPAGIDYQSPDGKPVHLVVMYFIPDTQKIAYLKEISGLAQAVSSRGDVTSIANAESVSAVRDQLLDWVSGAVEAGIPQVQAKMIRLEARQAAQVAPTPAAAPVLRDKQRLLNRVARLRGQVEAAEKALTDGEDLSRLLHILAAGRGALDGLMAEVIEERILEQMGKRATPEEAKAVQELIGAIKSYVR
jgi:mannitol/fructose-specific phosphotransferase system IIA component (Ntr-type)/DNA-binding FrmR family transcriptional regulator